MKEDNVEIIFSGGMSLKRSVSFRKATEIARFLAEDDNPMPLSSPSAPVSLAKTVSHNNPGFGSAYDTIKTTKPKTFPQRIAALAYYITKRDKGNEFDPKEVQSLLRRMGMTPQNFSRDLSKAEQVFGYVSEEPNGQYILTDTGKETVETGFESAETPITRKRRAKKNTKTKKE